MRAQLVLVVEPGWKVCDRAVRVTQGLGISLTVDEEVSGAEKPERRLGVWVAPDSAIGRRDFLIRRMWWRRCGNPSSTHSLTQASPQRTLLLSFFRF
jgi:hypothetical protein